ncbi:MAG: hypothetical protein NT027_11470 [Proteobacteria bacterium]|nr:hypothetical protein [Pseudomonadota bacterium]
MASIYGFRKHRALLCLITVAISGSCKSRGTNPASNLESRSDIVVDDSPGYRTLDLDDNAKLESATWLSLNGKTLDSSNDLETNCAWVLKGSDVFCELKNLVAELEISIANNRKTGPAHVDVNLELIRADYLSTDSIPIETKDDLGSIYYRGYFAFSGGFNTHQFRVTIPEKSFLGRSKTVKGRIEFDKISFKTIASVPGRSPVAAPVLSAQIAIKRNFNHIKGYEGLMSPINVDTYVAKLKIK